MRNTSRSGNGIGADLLALIGDLLKSIGRGLGLMLGVIFCGGLIGAAAGAVYSISQDAPMLQSLAFGGFGGAFLALLGIIFVMFANSW